ncbi:MAG: hypothetical protein QM270_07105 [Bacillota bacterium]|nr:hypothetical protein [Bacillota bacterium]
MAYTKHQWLKRLGSGLNKFRDTISNQLFALVNEPDSVTQEGTPLREDWLNEMEQGIYDAHGLAGAAQTAADAAQSTANAALPASSYTAADVLAKIKTVHGSGSGLDADKLDGKEGAAYLERSGGVMTGALDMGLQRIVSLQDPANEADAVPLGFVRDRFALSSAYNHENGYLIRTRIPATLSTMLTLYVYGNSYTGIAPVLAVVQGYHYIPSDAFLNTGAVATGNIADIKFFIYQDKIHIWLRQQRTFTTLFFHLHSTVYGVRREYNCIESVANAAMPTSGVTRLKAVDIDPLWHARNDGIDSGLDADKLDGMEPSSPNAGNTIVQRDGNGRFLISSPISAGHAANKSYVDSKILSGTSVPSSLEPGQIFVKI